jgi:predicted signal transduction protein with EAL and GGDEF domain
VERDVGEAARIAERIREAIAAPLTIGNELVPVTASIGVAVFPMDATTRTGLFQNATLAMQESKSSGKNRVTFFGERLNQGHQRYLALQFDLERAVASEEFVPFFQPLVDIVDHKLSSFEVLARWQHPDQGTLPPAAFITTAEEMGLIDGIFWSILRQACMTARAWSDPVPIAVNVSPVQFADGLAFTSRLLAILEEAEFPAERLIIEITENAIISDMDAARVIVSTLRGKGVRLALDDFGTGYASLTQLSELPFDIVKIDRSFVGRLSKNRQSFQIIASVINLCTSLGTQTVAEGVETEEDLIWLRSLGCRLAQGFLFSKPVAASQAGQIVDRWRNGFRRGPELNPTIRLRDPPDANAV